MFGRKQKRERSKGPKGSVSFSKTLPYWDIQENIMFLQDGRLVYGVYFEPPSHIHFTEEELVGRQSTLKTVFDLAIPDGETFRTYTSLRSALEDEIEETRRYADECADPVLRELTLARAAMLERKILDGEVSHWKFFATVTVTPTADARFSMDEPPSPQEVQQATLNAQAAQAATVAQMAAAGFAARAMTGQDVFGECFYYLNPGWPTPPAFIPQAERQVHSIRRGRPDHQTLIRQLTSTRVDNLQASGPILGDQYVEVLSLARLPEYTETGYLGHITDGLHGTYYVIVEATRENDYDVSNELEKKKTDLWTRVRAPGVIPNGRAANLLDEIEAAQKLDGVESRFEAAVSVVLVASTAQELERMKRKARGNVVRLRAGAPISYGFQSTFQYLVLAPFTAEQSNFLFKPYTSNIIDLFPPIAPWRGFESGAITFQSRDKSFVKFDLFTPLTKTPHFAIFAPPGSGKTVLAQSLYGAHLTKYKDAVLVVSDAKQDFAYFFKALRESGADSEIINFGYDSGTRFNIFDLEEGVFEPDGQKVSSLNAFIRIFVESPSDVEKKDYEDVAIIQAILATYKQFKEEDRRPQMSDFQRMLGTIESYTDTGQKMEPAVLAAARSVSIRLRKTLGSSPLAPFIDCQSNKKITSRLIYLNTYGIPETDTLMRRVAHHIVKGIMWNTAKSYAREIHKFIFIDEFENQIQTAEEVADIKQMLRVFRSFGVSFGIATQDPHASQYFGSLKDSFSHLFVGGYSSSVARRTGETPGVVEVLSLPKVMETKLPELTTINGKHAEFALLIKQGGEDDRGERVGDIIQVEESKFGLALFASGKDEVTKKDRYIEKHGGVIQGVKRLVLDTHGSVV